MSDSLGDRIKRYENAYRFCFPRRTYTIIRVDGKAFHSATRSCEKPFDTALMWCMNAAAMALCQEIHGAKFAYVQSDEISVLVTDFEKVTTSAWFDGNLQKLASVSASVATAFFNEAVREQQEKGYLLKFPKCVAFDSRAFIIPDWVEVSNYFLWRQKDAERNSLQMLTRSHYSHEEVHNKNASQQHDLLHKKKVNWNDLPADRKRGRTIIRQDDDWAVDNDMPVITQDREYLNSRIPRVG